MPPTANVFWSESLPPQLSLGKDTGYCRGLLISDMVTRPWQYVDIVQLLLQLSSETDTFRPNFDARCCMVNFDACRLEVAVFVKHNGFSTYAP